MSVNALSPPDARGRPAAEARISAGDLALSLQFCRANAMSLARLQLALDSGNRRRAMEAMDRLHALDAEIERVVNRLPTAGGADPALGSITHHLGEQKVAIAFEKLALASGIGGPDLVSSGAEPQAAAEPPPTTGWPPLPALEPVKWKPVPSRRIVELLLALVILAALAAVALAIATIG